MDKRMRRTALLVGLVCVAVFAGAGLIVTKLIQDNNTPEAQKKRWIDAFGPELKELLHSYNLCDDAQNALNEEYRYFIKRHSFSSQQEVDQFQKGRQTSELQHRKAMEQFQQLREILLTKVGKGEDYKQLYGEVMKQQEEYHKRIYEHVDKLRAI